VPVAVLMGEDEIAAGQVTIKDLKLGAQMAKAIESNEEWRESRPAQSTVAADQLVAAIKAILNA